MTMKSVGALGRRADLLLLGLSLTLYATSARAKTCQIGICRCQTAAQAAITLTKEGHEWSRNFTGLHAVGTLCNGSDPAAIKGMTVTCSGMQERDSLVSCYPASTQRCWEQIPPKFEETPLYRNPASPHWFIPQCKTLTPCKDNVPPFQNEGAEYEVKQGGKYKQLACKARSAPCPGNQHPETPPTRYTDRSKCTAPPPPPGHIAFPAAFQNCSIATIEVRDRHPCASS